MKCAEEPLSLKADLLDLRFICARQLDVVRFSIPIGGRLAARKMNPNMERCSMTKLISGSNESQRLPQSRRIAGPERKSGSNSELDGRIGYRLNGDFFWDIDEQFQLQSQPLRNMAHREVHIIE